MSEKSKFEEKLEKLEKDPNRQFLGAVREDCFIQDLQLRCLRAFEEDEFSTYAKDYGLTIDNVENINKFKENVYDNVGSPANKFVFKNFMRPSERYRYNEYKKIPQKEVVLSKSLSGSTGAYFELSNMLRDYYAKYGKDTKHPKIACMVATTIDKSVKRFRQGYDAKTFLKDLHLWGNSHKTNYGKEAQQFLSDVADKYIYILLERTRVRDYEPMTMKEARKLEEKELTEKLEKQERLRRERLAHQNHTVNADEERKKRDALKKKRDKDKEPSRGGFER